MSLGKMILRRKKAVSPVIATILLIALTVTAAAIVYFVVVPLLTVNPELVTTDYGKISGTTNQYEIELKNIGQDVANIANLEAFELTNTTDTDNPSAAYIGTDAVTFPYVINQGDTVIFVLEFAGNFTPGGQYTLTVIYDEGATLEIPFTY
ncbi:MAG: type IV pilin [Candidatus Heimdallarchaeota archaeon]